MRDYLMLFLRNFPHVIRESESVRSILSHKDCRFLEKRNEKGDLIGALLYHENTILMLCVDKPYRKQGIGGALLQKAEEEIRAAGYSDVVIGAGFSYLAPGVPMHQPIFPSPSEVAINPPWEDHSAFFQKRGYTHNSDSNCFDLLLEPITVEATFDEDLVFTFAEERDKEAVLTMVEDAYASFAKHYRKVELYQKDSPKRILLVWYQDQLAGALILSPSADGVGRIGCVTVLKAFRGQGIATRLVHYATHQLALGGVKKAFVGYTYSGLEKLYGKVGYQISSYYLKAKKRL